jgi:hypothetical protein
LVNLAVGVGIELVVESELVGAEEGVGVGVGSELAPGIEPDVGDEGGVVGSSRLSTKNNTNVLKAILPKKGAGLGPEGGS